MAELINLAGTTSHSFTIGEDGVTTYHGKATPPIEVGKPGDIYIQDTTEIIVGGEDTGEFRPYGKVYMKLVVDGETKWEPIKNYSFDTPIITHEETEEKSNNYKISLQSAKAPTTATSSTKANDYEKNHDNFGVTRFGTDAEVKVSSTDANTVYNNYQSYSYDNAPTIYTSTTSYMPDKNIAVTPAQMAANLTVEMKRALKVEGKLNDLDSHLTKTNLVAAINSEYTRAYNEENYLQQQIDAITSKSDVADVVENYSELVSYDSSGLFSDDVIKVLEDETVNNATTYYRFSPVPSTPDVSVTTKAALDAYPTTGLSEGDVAKVDSDESFSPAEPNQYYEWREVNGVFSWVWAGPKTNDDPQHPDVKYYWDYIGKEGSYYTKSEADLRFVNATENVSESINGVKTFNNNEVKIKSTSINSTNTSTAGNMHINFIDTNNVEMGTVKNELTNDNKVVSTIGATKVVNSSAVNSNITTVVESDGTTYATAPSPAASNATTGNTKIATVEWVNDPVKSTNVVHRTGDETITGSKNFTGATVNVATQTRGNSTTLAASTAFVADGLSLKLDTSKMPAISSGTAGQVVACPDSGDSYVWKTVRDITTLAGLDDTTVSSPANDQSLVYDSTSSKWVNKRPMIATISYW